MCRRHPVHVAALLLKVYLHSPVLVFYPPVNRDISNPLKIYFS